jgi:NADH:ubiquinone oxidoreductase subunit H
MRFALFFLAEYANASSRRWRRRLFFGGWLRRFRLGRVPCRDVPYLPVCQLDVVPHQVVCVPHIFIWVRALPALSLRPADAAGVEVLIPLAIANLVVTGIVKVILS